MAELSADQRTCYWAEVLPQPLFREWSDECNKVVDELLSVKRPRAAFAAVHMVFKNFTTDRLVRLLTDVATVNAEPVGHYQMSAHDISAAFDVLSTRSDADPGALARLEFMYIDGLNHTKHGIKILERQLSNRQNSLCKRSLSPSVVVTVAKTHLSCARTILRRLNGSPNLPTPCCHEPGGCRVRTKKASWTGASCGSGLFAARTLARECGREEIGDSRLASSSPTARLGRTGCGRWKPYGTFSKT